MVDNEVLKRLDRIAEGIEGISAVMNKPENKIKKAMELAWIWDNSSWGSKYCGHYL
jgi:hypothetical protein